MEESKKCIYCKEIMTYGQRPQILSTYVMNEGRMVIQKSITYIVYCWSCPMEYDNCDIVLDKNDADKNKLNIEEASKELHKPLTYIKEK